VHLQLTSLNRPIKLVRLCDWLLQLRATPCLTVNTGCGWPWPCPGGAGCCAR